MRAHRLTFEWLQAACKVGPIRSATVDHTRGIITLVCDETPCPEGATLVIDKMFTTNSPTGEPL